jgi:hypothetical protein
MNQGKNTAFSAIFISILVTAVIVFMKLHMSRTEGKLTLLFLTISPYLFLAIINCVACKQRAIRSIWILSYANCIIGLIAYIILYPSSPTPAGGGASMAALIFFFVTFFQLLLVTVFLIVFAINALAKRN